MTGLLLLTMAVPIALSLFWPWRTLRPLGRVLAPWAAAPALVLALGDLAGPAVPVYTEIPTLLVGIRLGLDAPGAAFLLLTALLWLLAGAFAWRYHARDPRGDSFFGFFVLTLTGNLGLVLAQDLVSFYLFFALMTFSAYGLVIHRRDPTVIRAGRVYLTMAIAGELALLAGVLGLVVAGGGSVGLGSEMEAVWTGLMAEPATMPPSVPFASPGFLAALLVAGFGVKAGLAPLHIWLPLAHPAAPTAASALLSGVLIKAGLLGWLRVLPTEVAVPGVGECLFVVGAATALYAVVVGLCQDEAKTVLAYSSVSQMGYSAMAAGILVSDPALAPAALAAAVFFALHHGLAKGALFLSVGVGDRLQGPAALVDRRRRLLLLGSLLPALALAGAPFTTGAMVKTVLVNAGAGLTSVWSLALAPLFFVAAAGTTLLMARFLVTLDRRVRDAGRPDRGVSGLGTLWVPWGVLLGLVATGPLWLPHAYAPPETAGVPSVLYAPSAAWLPVLVGVAVAAAVFARPRVLGALARLRIPPGDILVPVEALLRWMLAPPSQRGAGIRVRLRTRLAYLTRSGRPPARGAVFGLLILVVTLVLVTTLAR